jgi:ABC-type amino acid transport substrate-binding protein
MGKILGSVAFLVAVLFGGYFADAGFKAKVDGMFGKHPSQVATVQGTSAAPAAVQAQAGSTLSRILEKGVVMASVQNPSKPFYSAEGNRAKGFNVDFMNLMFDKGDFKGKGLAVKGVEVGAYADVPKQLLDGNKVDIAIDGLTFNDDDLPGVNYTIPYVKDFGYSLITLKGNNVASAADLAGGKIGVLQGDPDAKAFVESAFPGVKIVELSDKADGNGKWIVGHLKAGKVDAVVYDYPFAVAEVEGTDLQFAMTKIKGSDIQYRIGVRKGDKDLLAALNTAIRVAMEDPAYPEMLKTYFMSTSVAAVRRASSGEAGYVVAKGDTLSTIAKAQLGDMKRYVDIQARNNLANPNFIAVGQKLVIPAK